MAPTALDELLESLDLSPTDITQLRENTITLRELITRHLASIAWTDEIERRVYVKSEWLRHSQRNVDAYREDEPAPEWQLPEKPDTKLDPTQALDNLRCEIADAVLAYNGGSVGREWEYAEVRTKIPKWITWPMLSKWVAEYDLERAREAGQMAAALAISRAESAPAPPSEPEVERAAPAPAAAWEMDRSAGSFVEEAVRAASAPGTWEWEVDQRIRDFPEPSEDALPI